MTALATLRATRSAQYPLTAEFTLNYNDTVTDINGVLQTLSTVGSYTVDAINLPVGAILVGGDVTTETAFTGSTAFNITIGDSASSNRYLAATDKTTAARTALTLTGYVGQGENLRVVINPTVATVTAGKLTIRVQYIVRGRANEAVTA